MAVPAPRGMPGSNATSPASGTLVMETIWRQRGPTQRYRQRKAKAWETNAKRSEPGRAAGHCGQVQRADARKANTPSSVRRRSLVSCRWSSSSPQPAQC